MYSHCANWANCVSTSSLAIKPILSLMRLARVLVFSPSMSVKRSLDDEQQCFNALSLICGCSFIETLETRNCTTYVHLVAGQEFLSKSKAQQ